MMYPNFLVIGAPRSGTTSLYRYLCSHPEIFMSPIKETRFFAYKNEQVGFNGITDPYTINKSSITSPKKYQKLFKKADPKRHKAAGEASPVYMYEAEKSAPRIYQYKPQVKLVAIIRNPVDRAFSDYLNMKRLGRDLCPSFAEAIKRENHRIQQNWSPFYRYLSKGFYGHQLNQFFRYFNRSQIYITTFRQFAEATSQELKQILKFLGVSNNLEVQHTTAHNKSGVPKNLNLHRFLTHPLLPVPNFIKNLNIVYQKAELPLDIRERLIHHFYDDIEQTESLLGLNLEHWKQVK